MFESIARFKRLENQSWNLNLKKNIGEGMKMFRKYQSQNTDEGTCSTAEKHKFQDVSEVGVFVAH
jgi:hypothetical protein